MAFKAPSHCPNPFFHGQIWLYLGLAQNLSCLLIDYVAKLKLEPQMPSWLCFPLPPKSHPSALLPTQCLLLQHHWSMGSQICWLFHIALPLYVQVSPPGILSTLELSSISETFRPCREWWRAKSWASSRPDTGWILAPITSYLHDLDKLPTFHQFPVASTGWKRGISYLSWMLWGFSWLTYRKYGDNAWHVESAQ